MEKKRILVPIADGSEEIEAVSIIDVLRRAGAEVTVASIPGDDPGDREITASRGVKIVADRVIGECVGETFDLIVLPGGSAGAEKLRDSDELTGMLLKQREEGRLYAAICAAPALVLEHHGLLEDHRATCHPNFTGHLSNPDRTDSRVVVDGKVATSRGPGTAIEFALTLVEMLWGKEKREEVSRPMIVR